MTDRTCLDCQRGYHAVREHILGLLADETLVQSIGLYLGQTEGYNYACEGDRSAARAGQPAS